MNTKPEKFTLKKQDLSQRIKKKVQKYAESTCM